MPDLTSTFADPEFRKLPALDKVMVISAVDPEFAALPPDSQVQVIVSGLHPGLTPKPSGDKGYWATLGSDIKSIPGTLGAMISNPPRAIKSVADAQLHQIDLGAQDFKDKKYIEALGHAGASLLPIIGPMAADAGTDIGEGRPRQGYARVTELLGPEAFRAGYAGGKAIAPITKGAVEGAMETKGWQPGALVGGTVGGGAGYLAGGAHGAQLGAEIGAAVGGGLPSIRGAVKGAAKAIRDQRTLELVRKSREGPQVVPAWAQGPEPTVAPPEAVVPIYTTLPLGES